MELQVGNKRAGRAVENIPGKIIFYIGLHISHTRAED
jgi:hypothetical protein